MFDVIALDLDGTLLRNDKTVSDRTLRALKKYEELGKQIVIITARPPRLDPIVLPEELQREFMIYYNGAEIYHNNHKVYSSEISKKSVHEVIKLLRKENSQCKLGFEINNKLYTNSDDVSIFGTPTYEVVDVKTLDLSAVVKILIDMKGIKDQGEFHFQLPSDCKLVVTDNGDLGQLADCEVNKLNALCYILDKLNTSLDRVLFFGDDINDIELLEACGVGVAMGNAVDKVKGIADYITLTNEEDGIADFLEQL